MIPFPSWAETETKSSILEFVRTVADEADPDHVPVAERVAVFDDDGTFYGINDAASIQYLTDTVSAERGVGTVPYIHGGNAGVNEV